MIVVNIEIDGDKIGESDEFSNTISIAVVEATDKLT